MAAQLVLATPPPPGLQEATKNSTLAWQHDLESLFHHAKDRFPDVVWELVGSEEEDENRVFEEVWGHKGIVYARAPPSFQSRYFTFRANGAVSPAPYSSSPSYPGESALSLGLESSINLALDRRTPSPAPSTSLAHGSVAPHGSHPTLLRLTTNINPSLFSDELEYLYTGKGFGEAFEFLFDSSDARERPPGGPFAGSAGADGLSGDDPESLRIDKLRKDLVFMWRSRLYSDVRIALTGNFGGAHHENTTAIFSSHRFILVSRSPYFHTALIAWPNATPSTNGSEPPTLTLPSPPFTPASLHFTLGFIYTGTLIFSHRSYDLSTAFAILRSSLYLSLSTLHDEVQARIIQEMMHGLFHAFIPFAAYESLTQGRWGTGGCRCRQCARRAPRVLEFAIEEDVRNAFLERGARRALVGMFGEGWCTAEFAALSPKLRDSLLRGLGKRTTPRNAFAMLWAAEHALRKIGSVIEPWADVVREMLVQGRAGVDEVLAKESERCFGAVGGAGAGDEKGDGEDGEEDGEAGEWMEIMRSGGVRFEDGERVEWAMAAVLRGVREPWAPALYQTLVSSILLRPHPTDISAPMLPVTSHVHVQVEQARIELLKWIGKRWLDVRMERGFDCLEGWALKEISDHIEVPIDDLLSPPSYTSNKGLSPSPSSHSLSPSAASPSALKRQTKPNHHHHSGNNHRQQHHHLRPMSNHPHTSKVDAESDAASSMRVSVLSRSIAGASLSGAGAGVLRSSRSSVASSARTGRDRDRDGDQSSRHSLLSPSSRPGTGSRNGSAALRSSSASMHSMSSAASASTISAVRPGAGVERNRDTNNNNNGNNNNKEEEKMSPAKRIASEVRAANANAASNTIRKAPDRDRERPDSKLTPSIVEPDGVGDSDIYLTDEDVDADLGAGDEDKDEVGVDEQDGEDGESGAATESVLDGEREEEEGMDVDVDNSEVGDDDDTVSFSGNGNEDQAQTQDDTQSLTSEAPSVYHTPRQPGPRGLATNSVASAATSASRPGVRTRTTTTTSPAAVSRPKALAPSVKSLSPSQKTPPRKTVISSASSSSIRTSQYSSAVGGSVAASSRPSSRGSAYSVTTPRTTMRLAGTGSRTSPSPSTSRPSPTTAKPASRPVSRVSTRSISGGSRRPVSSASTATTDTGSASTYRTAPGNTGAAGLSVSVRQRRTSATSTTSTRTAGGGGRSAAGSPVHARARRISGASVSSVASNASSVRSAAAGARTRTAGAGTPVKRVPSVPDPTKLSPVVARAGSGTVGRTKSSGGASGSGPIQPSVSGSSSSSVKSPTAPAKKLSVGAAGATLASAARSRTLSHKKSTESVRRPLNVNANTKTKENEKPEGREEVPPVPPAPSPAVSVAPALSNKDKEGGDEEKENVTPLATQVPPVVPPTTISDASAPPPPPPPPENTSSTITIRPKVYSDNNEHKKTSSSASSSSVATLRRKGSTDTIKTVKSSGLSSVTTSDGSSKAAGATEAEPKSKQQQQGKSLPASSPLPPLPLSAPSSPTPPSLSPPKKPALTKQLSSIDSLLASDVPTGSTLEIGIPCIISLKRKRFKAYARYIGEVVGERGPWVGVEVPLPVGGDSWGDGSGSGFGLAGSAFSTSSGGGGGAGSGASGEKADDRQWNDGSWGGIRYFEIGGMMMGSEWDYSAEERGARRRRIDAGSVGGAVWGSNLRDNKGMKREGDQLSISSERMMKRVRSVSPAVSDMSGTESRGLFVRPQQVLYVVDAVGADL
ncbi:hypothetical protein CVT25_008168 [Psilocybe cyanescens]|uniref:BTB domain-containing protein n=1 Tax=Psilocybe cyanescens TaxID=93625 RepID=A0A409XG84_PSICY|nr:hypothetical protein CVT25_008168 [Psilocybe cyanescens]